MRLFYWVIVVCVCVGCLPRFASADTTAYDGTARWWTKPNTSDSNSWEFSDPTASDTATYIAGPDETDGVVKPAVTDGPQTKFANPLGNRTYFPWNPFGIINAGPGPKGSKTTNFAYGSGFSYAGFVYGTNWMYMMSAISQGTLGGGAGASWDAITKVTDPSYMSPSAFEDVGSMDTADVYVPVGLIGENGLTLMDPAGPNSTYISSIGSVTLHVDIATALTTYNLLDLVINGATDKATVTPSSLGSSVSYYLQNNLTDGPPTNSATSASGIQSAINSDLSNGQLISDINIGIVLSGMPVPTQSMDEAGDVAAVDINAASEEADVPEPASMAGALSLTLLVAARRIRNRAAAINRR